jgi:ATP-dependent DNA helicase RecQ
VCAGAWYETDVPLEAVHVAQRTLREVGVEVEPRVQWPSGMARLGVGLSGRIDADERVAPGRVVARLTDLGWGQRLRTLLAASTADGPADAALLEACVRVLASWPWEQRPVGVVAMPSTRRPLLVGSVAAHLAEVGRLPLLGTLAVADDREPGEPGGNSAFRLSAVHDRFEVPAALAERLREAGGPVLLVDDLVDSRWTVTVAGRALRLAGAEGVLPFALAVAA